MSTTGHCASPFCFINFFFLVIPQYTRLVTFAVFYKSRVFFLLAKHLLFNFESSLNNKCQTNQFLLINYMYSIGLFIPRQGIKSDIHELIFLSTLILWLKLNINFKFISLQIGMCPCLIDKSDERTRKATLLKTWYNIFNSFFLDLWNENLA